MNAIDLITKVAALYQRPHYHLSDDTAIYSFNDIALTVGDLREAKRLIGEDVVRTVPEPCGPLPELGEFARSMKKV